MNSDRHAQLNPWALAVATGCAVLIGFIVFSAPLGGMMGMGGFGRMMGGFVGGMWFGVALVAALLGALIGWIYNAVNGRSAAPK